MLNDQQLNELMDRLNVPANGRAVVERIRSSNPSRNVEGRAGNVACRYPSKKMGCVIQAESHKNELAAVYMWEHDERTYEYYDQPPQIKMNYLKADGRRTAHVTTPDFFLIQENFIGWVECKPEEWLLDKEKERSPLFLRDESLNWRCPPGIAYANSFGLGFQLRSSAQNPWVYIRNLMYLADYWRAKVPPEYADGIKRLQERLRDEKEMRIADMLIDEHIGDADALNYAVTNELVYVDLFHDLLSEPEYTKVYVSQEIASILRSSRIRSESRLAPVKALTLTPGGTFIWANKVFTLKSVGGDQVILQDQSGEFLNMKRDQLERLSRTGEIQANDDLVDNDCVLSGLYRAASPGDLEEAAKRSAIISAGGNPLTSTTPISPRTLRHWKQRQREAAQKYDDPFIGLVSRKSARGNRARKLDHRVIEIMRDVIAREYATADAKELAVCWGHARNLCEAESLIPPSEKAFRREIKLSMSGFEMTLAREGQRAAYSQEPVIFYLDRSAPRHGERPFEIAHLDHTQLDIQLVGSKFGELLAKPWLSIMIDAYSRSILAFALTFDPPSYRTNMLLMRDCLRRHCRVPANVVVDRGSDFHCLYFESFLARFAIAKKSRPPQKARFGSLVERFFGISNKQLIHNLRGNNKALQKPRQLSDTHDPRERAVWTYRELFNAMDEYLFRIYADLEHPALGVSPRQALQVGMAKTGLRPMRLIPMTDEVEMACLPSNRSGDAMIIPGKGVKIGPIYYQHALMRNPGLARKRVFVRYDPFNLGSGYAYIEGQWRLCQSEYFGLFEGRSEREIMIIAAEIAGKNKRAGERRPANAQKIAQYLMGLGTTEAQLLQQKKDAEQRSRYEDFEDAAWEAPQQPSDIGTEASSWSSIETTQMGEFK